jgi:hypothetical protein
VQSASVDASPDDPEAVEPSALDMPPGQALGEHTRTVFRVWVVLFAMVGAQMGWVLRPFVGRPELPFEWFRERQSNFFAAVLGALGPLTLFWYASSPDYRSALRCNGAMFLVASFAAQYLLRGYYRPLVRRNPRHRRMLACWAFIYVLVAIQLAWLLRPFIGAPERDVQFLRPEAWDNAYVYVGRLILQAFGL